MATAASGLKRSFDVFRNDIASPQPKHRLDFSASASHDPVGRSSSQQQTGSPLLRSEATSRAVSPSLFDELATASSLRTTRKFSPAASVLIIGIRGTGKSSLAVIASKTLQRPIIDADEYFLRYCGTSRTLYRQQHGPTKYAAQEVRVLRDLFTQHGTGFIIVCGPSATLDGSGGDLFKEFAQNHPVIYLLRDARSIARYLKIKETEKIERLLALCGPAYRASSNFEFFNVSEHGTKICQPLTSKTSLDIVREVPETPFLTLKDVEYDFVRLLRHVTGGSDCPNPDATSPFSSIPLPSRDFTYAVTIPFSRLEDGDLDLEDVAVGADAFEISITASDVTHGDRLHVSQLFDRISHQYARVRRHTVIPIIYHVDISLLRPLTVYYHGSQAEARNTYLDLLHHGLRLGVELLTVDLSLNDFEIRALTEVKVGTQIIGNLHLIGYEVFDWGDSLVLQLHQRAQNLQCDILRLSKQGSSIQDNFGVQNFVQRMKQVGQSVGGLPVIAYNTGAVGRMSCCFNSVLTPVTHPSVRADLTPRARNARTMITASESQEALFKTFVLDPLNFFIIGGIIQHSLSPAMHNAAFKACGMHHQYIIRQISSLQGVTEMLNHDNFGGCSVGLPFKMEVVNFINKLSPSARAIGAVNTIVPVRDDPAFAASPNDLSFYSGRNRAGKVKELYGYNTDWVGIMNTIREGLSPVNAVGPKSTGLVTGAGGMARASIYAMIQLGVRHIFIYSRTVATAEKIAQHFENQDPETLMTNFAGVTPGRVDKVTITVLRSRSELWPTEFRQPTVIVSTVPSASPPGMPPPNFTLPEQWLQSSTGGVVLELAYKPLVTALMRQMRAVHIYSRGWVFLDGLELLPQQGFPQFELFTGRRAPRRLMKAEVLRAYQASHLGEADEAGVSQRLEDIESPAVS